MCSQSILNQNKNKVLFLYKKSEMLRFVYKSEPTAENKNALEAICEDLDDELSKYYSNTLFFLKLTNETLFEAYLGLKKEKVKRNLLNQLINQ